MKNLQSLLETFSRNREWQQYHSPKNLAMALSVEASELMEIFQWMTPEESRNPDAATLNHIEEEIGDVMIYLATLAGKFQIDPLVAARKKLKKNEIKYPANSCNTTVGE